MHSREFLKATARTAAFVLAVCFLTSCSTITMPGIGGGGGGGGGGGSDWVGRRVWPHPAVRYWGQVKKPNEPWSKARLVVMNERYKHVPDRLPEGGEGERGHGFDNNYEYRLKGTFSGNEIYDPNSDKVLPEFVLRDYELISKTPPP
jgi:hypothetical protein